MEILMSELATSALSDLSANAKQRIVDALEEVEEGDFRGELERSEVGHVLRTDEYVIVTDLNRENDELRVLDIAGRDEVKEEMMP
jgi:mRNA-degrading endonuclease RelE of RelBE toxin-antitoxin system